MSQNELAIIFTIDGQVARQDVLDDGRVTVTRVRKICNPLDSGKIAVGYRFAGDFQAGLRIGLNPERRSRWSVANR